MVNYFPTVLVEFAGELLIIDLPSINDHISQHGPYQTFRIGGHELTIDLVDAINHLLSGEFDIHHVDENTIKIDATELAVKIGFVEKKTDSWQQMAEKHGWSDAEINDFRYVFENLFPNVDNDIDEVINAMLHDRTEEELDDFFGTIGDMFSECECVFETAGSLPCKFSCHIKFNSSNF